MTVPKLPPFDSEAANIAWRALKKLDGSPYQVFAGSQFPTFIKAVRGLRDHLEALRLGVFGPEGIKGDLDDFRENNGVAHISFDRRLDAIEARLNDSPFPG